MNGSHFNFNQAIKRELPGIAFLVLVLIGLGAVSVWVFGLLVSSARLCAAY